MAEVLHYLVSDPEGPIYSRRGGTALKVGNDGRWRFACDFARVRNQDEKHGGTTETWTTTCEDCKETAVFRERDRPKPGCMTGVAEDG